MKIRKHSKKVVTMRGRGEHQLVNWRRERQLLGGHRGRDNPKPEWRVEYLRSVDHSHTGDIERRVPLALGHNPVPGVGNVLPTYRILACIKCPYSVLR